MSKKRLAIVACAAMIGLSAPVAVLASGAESLSPKDQHFINEAWDINTTEVRLGNTVEKKATEEAVKSFGKRMIADHTKLNHELTKLAGTEDAKVPNSLDKQDENLIANLSRLNGSDFDKRYISAMIQGHTQAVAMFETEAKCETPVGKWAAEALPTIKAHLALAEKTGKEIGVEMPGATAMDMAAPSKAETTAVGVQPAAKSAQPAASTPASGSSAHHWWQFWNW